MRDQPRTDTSGTDHSGRPSRTLTPSLEVLDVRAEGVGLLAEPQWTDGDRNSKTLLKSDGLRIVLTALRAGATMDNDDPDEAVAIHALQGSVRVGAAGEDVSVGMGELVCLAGGDPWTITAEADSLLLLSVGRTPGSVRGQAV
jgi:quercetin dioxygenase-like cupin family protein